MEKLFDVYETTCEEIKASQKLIEKKKNLFYQRYKESENLVLNTEFEEESFDGKYKQDYEKELNSLKLGMMAQFKKIKLNVKRAKRRAKSRYYKEAIIKKIKGIF